MFLCSSRMITSDKWDETENKSYLVGAVFRASWCDLILWSIQYVGAD
jgi:hypothetical protein